MSAAMQEQLDSVHRKGPCLPPGTFTKPTQSGLNLKCPLNKTCKGVGGGLKVMHGLQPGREVLDDTRKDAQRKSDHPDFQNADCYSEHEDGNSCNMFAVCTRPWVLSSCHRRRDEKTSYRPNANLCKPHV